MRVFQTIHKYAPHIPLFEKRNNITDQTNLTFAELQRLIIDDGYASSYILFPAIEGKTDNVFFTIWNYERMQFLWAKEHGLNTRDLNKIKLAQVNWYKPDVFYNHSAFCDENFIDYLGNRKNILKICWYSVVTENPMKLKNYDIRLTLHRPYLYKWEESNLKSFELQPSFDSRLNKYDSLDKPIDFLFYGQYDPLLFGGRNNLVDKLLEYSLTGKVNMRIHLHYNSLKKPFINIRFIRRIGYNTKHSAFIATNSLPPLYGRDLYETIGKSKFVINGYGDFNTEFKSNMRLFEALNCGSLLISESGTYPEGFEANKNYIPYNNVNNLIDILPELLSNYSGKKEDMKLYVEKAREMYSKENQWKRFKEIVIGNM